MRPRALLVIAVLAALASCTRTPEPRSESAAPKAVVAVEQVRLDQLIRLCQEATGESFTYSKETGDALKEREVVVAQTADLSPDQFMELLRRTLDEGGYTLEAVGPEDRRVHLVKQRSR